MSDTSSPPPEFPEPEDDNLGHDFRIMLVLDKGDKADDNEMDEFILENVDTFTEMNVFFDAFDQAIALPNKNNIKYDVGSDGLVVIVVDNDNLKGEVVTFIKNYISS